jgi:large conductance mechanosensitive channel
VLKDFREFLLRGNLVDLAVAVVIGTAFAALIKSFVDNIIMPLIAAIFGKQSFDSPTFTINSSVFHYGSFLSALITFVLIAAVVFFFVVKPVSVILNRFAKEKAATPDPNEVLLGDITDLLQEQNGLLRT